MDYDALALELMQNCEQLSQAPATRELGQMIQGELFVLNYLADCESGEHPNRISKVMMVSTARITAILNRLEEKQMILRETDPTDNRQVIVTLTRKGRDHIREKREETVAQVRQMLVDLGPEDAETYVRIQRRIRENHQQGLREAD